jgi:two-component system, LytTR family, response regulator
MSTIKTIIVDDEPLAIQGLELRLQLHDDVQIIERCRNGREAIKAIKTLKPDLVFLDVQMPGFDGFGVVQGLLDVEPPLIVFVTAFDEHAVRAFEAQAIDYLLKPVEDSRLAAALTRVRARLREKTGSAEAERLRAVVQSIAPEQAGQTPSGVPAESGFEKIINVRDRGQIFRVEVESIERIEAAGDYMCLHVAHGLGQAQTLILRETMKDLEKRLDPRSFQRIHRSAIVNLNQVREVKPHTNGECFLMLTSGAQVKVSRSYREVVARFV